MRRVARVFADAMLEEHVRGSTLIDKRCARRAAVLSSTPFLPRSFRLPSRITPIPAPHPFHMVAFSPPTVCLS